MPRPFPAIDVTTAGSRDNPAVRLFGLRFFADQTVVELLVELLLVAFSPKRLGHVPIDGCLPSEEALGTQWNTALQYAPKARLNLKLFSFLGASKLESRHETHRAHLAELDNGLAKRISATDKNPTEILRTLENLFLGFHGAGSQRTWCAQSFIPISPRLIACESIWRQSKGRSCTDWETALAYFQHEQNAFLARGGELLYLQLCAALRQSQTEVNDWIQATALGAFLSPKEKRPEWLRRELELALRGIMRDSPSTLDHVAELIDTSVDSRTANATDWDRYESTPRWSKCGWCPEESWKEGYLFAVELLRVCRASLGPIERIQMLETLCAMQLVRSLASQAARYAPSANRELVPAYRIAVSSIDEHDRAVKQVSQETVRALSKTIYDALRSPEIRGSTPLTSSLYREADNRYGHKLLIAVCKRLGLVVPQRGPGTRFVLSQRVLRLLLVVLCPKRYLSYETFKQAAKAHYGLVFDDEGLGEANWWATGVTIESFGHRDEWLMQMLEEAGALRRLSDSCALVENKAAPTEEEPA